MIKAAIIGGTGYTGLELLRILSQHPKVEIGLITSEPDHVGKKLTDIHPYLHGIIDYDIYSTDEVKNRKIDVAFLALPHGISMHFVKGFGLKNFKIIDLSGDFRITEKEYNKWYQDNHVCPEYIDEAIYGLPELFFNDIKEAQLIANPGCYPTASILPLIPLLKGKLVDPTTIIIDSKSGVSGAGVKAKESTHFPGVNENFSAYGIFSHRHTPEINQILSYKSKSTLDVVFTPHLIPLNRGILTTIYVKPNHRISQQKVNETLEAYYSQHPFVNIVNKLPGVKDVRGSNYCNIYADADENRKMIILVSVIDNLIKGASGQAVQNMNIMFDLDQETGLKALPFFP
ncbi:N-acetyl-gamma-glutamyl-phosphate reductase [Bacteroidota bacterium]